MLCVNSVASKLVSIKQLGMRTTACSRVPPYSLSTSNARVSTLQGSPTADSAVFCTVHLIYQGAWNEKAVVLQHLLVQHAANLRTLHACRWFHPAHTSLDNRSSSTTNCNKSAACPCVLIDYHLTRGSSNMLGYSKPGQQSGKQQDQGSSTCPQLLAVLTASTAACCSSRKPHRSLTSYHEGYRYSFPASPHLWTACTQAPLCAATSMCVGWGASRWVRSH
jgi:hypothetical protein